MGIVTDFYYFTNINMIFILLFYTLFRHQQINLVIE